MVFTAIFLSRLKKSLKSYKRRWCTNNEIHPTVVVRGDIVLDQVRNRPIHGAL